MRTLLILACTFTSIQSFAFTTVTLKKEIKLSNDRSPILVKDLLVEKGASDYCHLIFSSRNNAETQVVPAGTKIEVNQSEMRNICKYDSGRKCVVSFTAKNHDQNVELDLLCRDVGTLASKLSIAKVNQIAEGTISVK